MKWSCSSSLCFNNFRTRDSHGNPLQYYRLPRDESIQKEYKKIFKTDGMNFKKGHICASHWSSGIRENTSHLPDVPVPSDQLEKLRLKCISAKKKVESAKTPRKVKEKLLLKNLERKYKTALSISTKSPTKIKPRASRSLIFNRLTPVKNKRTRTLSKREVEKRLEKTTVAAKSFEEVVIEKDHELERLRQTIKSQTENILKLESRNIHLEGIIEHLKSKQFVYEKLVNWPSSFKYVCGLSVENFDMVYKLLEPYLHLIPYPDCVNTGEKSVDKKSQLLYVLTICRHGLELKFMAFLINRSPSTLSRMFTGWVIFCSTVFENLELKPSGSFLLKKMPDVFVKTGHGLTDIVIDATEFKFQQASNLDLGSLMFSHYKNTHTGKALIGIAAHGMGLYFSDIYPGSISDSEITEKAGILNLVREEHEVMSDRGFAIQELCAIKGVYLNRPKQKDNDQYSEGEVMKHFNIASTRVHVERFIGRVRDFRILNNIWPLNQMDLLGSTWQMLCHITNLTSPPIGPSDK